MSIEVKIRIYNPKNLNKIGLEDLMQALPDGIVLEKKGDWFLFENTHLDTTTFGEVVAKKTNDNQPQHLLKQENLQHTLKEFIVDYLIELSKGKLIEIEADEGVLAR